MALSKKYLKKQKRVFVLTIIFGLLCCLFKVFCRIRVIIGISVADSNKIKSDLDQRFHNLDPFPIYT